MCCCENRKFESRSPQQDLFAAEEDWKEERHDMPAIFDNFQTAAERQGALPPELAGALERVKVVVWLLILAWALLVS